MSSNFEKVSELNVLFGNPKGNPFNLNWEKLEAQAKNIGDEFKELMEDGIAKKDLTAVRDAICDILVFTYGLGHMAGVPVDEDMDAVDASNRSKFCSDFRDEHNTCAKYLDLGIQVYVDGEYPMKRVKSKFDQVDKNGKDGYRKGKMLKSVKFREPKFRKLDCTYVDGLKSVPELQSLAG